MKKNTSQDQQEIATDTPFLHRPFVNKLPFRFVIAVPFTLLILFAVGLTGYLSYRNGQMAVNQLASDLHKENIAHISQLLDNYLSTPTLINQLNLDAIHLGTLDVHNLDTIQSNFLAQMQHFETVVSVAYANEQREYIGPARKVLGVDIGVGISSEKTGHVLEGYEITPEGDRKLIFSVPDYDPRTRPWYQAAVQAGRQVWTPIYLWSSGDVGIDAVVPVYSNDNKLLGVLSASLTLDTTSAYLQNLKVSEHGESFIVERSGLLVASSTIHEPFTRAGDQLKRLSVLDVEDPVMKAAVRALEQEVGTLENITDALSYDFELSNERYFAQVVPYRDEYGLNWLIVTVIPESDFMAQINVGNRQTGILIGLSLLVSIIFAALITLWVTYPIVQLNDSARALASGEWGRRVSVNRTDEIGELSKSFNHMAEQLQASFVSIQASEKRYHGLFEDSHISLWEEDGSVLKKHLDELSDAGITDWRVYFDEHPEQVRACAAMIKTNDVNRATMTFFGADTKDAFSNGLSPFLTEKSYETIRNALIALAKGNHYYEADAIHQTNKGTEIIVHFRLSILPGYEDSWSKLLLSLEDITQRKQAEEELRLSEARYRAVVENQTEFIVRWRSDGVCTFANEAYYRYFGLTPEQAASSSLMLLVAEADRSVVEEKISRLLSGTVTSETDIHRVIKPNGSIGWQEWVDQAIHDEIGQIIEFQSVGRDITERKQAEETLREKTEELERFFISALDLLSIADTDGYFRRLNREWEKVLGYRLEDLEGKRFLDLVHPDDKQATLAAMAELDAQKEILDFTNRYRCKDGTYRWIEWRSIPHGDLIYAAARDITERKRMEDALREEEMKYRSLFEASHDIIMLLDRTGNILDINHRGEQLTGYSQSELRQMNVFQHLLPTEDHGIVREVIEDLVKGKARVYEYRWRTKAGAIIHFDGSSVPRVSVDGKFLSTLCMLRDITERKRMEEALAASEAELRALLASMNDVVLVIDRNGVYRKIAPTNPDLLYKPPSELLGKTLQDVFPAEQAETFLGTIRQVVEMQQTAHIEYQLVIDERVVWFGASISPMGADSTLWMARDITERKHAEDALRESEERFRSLSEAAFEGIMIHDNGIIQNANQAFASLFSYADPKELIGKNGLEILSFTPESRENVKASIGKGTEQVLEIEVVRPDGSIFPAETQGRDITFKRHKLRVIAMQDITKRKKAEQTLRDHAERQTALYNVLRKVSGELDPNVIAQIGVTAVLDMGRWQSVSISLLEANRQEWLTRAEGGPLSGSILGPYLLSQGVVGRVYRTGQTQSVPDVTTDPDFFTSSLSPIKSELAVPIRRNEQVIGALNIESDKLSSFTAEDVALAESLADTIGLALASAHLYAEAQLEINERKRAEERMRELTKRLVAAQEEERKRIAQELHDELGQALTAISIDLGGIEKALPPEASPENRARLIEARWLADEVDERISELALDLRPSLLDDLGLLPTLQWYVNRYSQRLGIEVAMDFKGLESRLPDEVETTLYRVIQEALTNIARHAQASTVRLSLERSAAAVTASIQDDGRGFDVEQAQGSAASLDGVGLFGIKDRVSTLGGRVEIHSRPGQGARIHIEIPL